MVGTISNRRAYVILTVRGPSGQEREVEFVLDTGFTGVLTLPPAACGVLSLPFARIQPAHLADGTRVILRVCHADILWNGRARTVEVLVMDGAPLIGMTLLDGHDVHLHVADGGSVTIQPFQTP
jgi:clan AA aspartic protease